MKKSVAAILGAENAVSEPSEKNEKNK